MKRTSSFLRSVALTSSLASIGVLMLAPASGYALNDAGTSTTKTSPFCNELPTKAITTTANITSLVNRVTTAWGQQDQKITADEQKVDQAVTAGRAAADVKRIASYTKLQAKATTSTEQAAVQTYIASVNTAVSSRRAAYDAARQTYRAGLASVIMAHRSTITSQFTTFKATASTAISVAEAGCTSTPSNGPTLRAALVASLASARETYQADRKSDTTVEAQVRQLAVTRDAAFKAADGTFQTAVQAAAHMLEQAFGSTNI